MAVRHLGRYAVLGAEFREAKYANPSKLQAVIMHRQFAQVPVRGADGDEQIAESGDFEADSTGSPVDIQAGKLRRLAVRGGAYIISARLLVQLFSWAVTIVTARILRPYDYGILTAAATFTNLADLLAEGGACKALVQNREVSQNDLAGAFTYTLLLSMAMFLTLFGCAGIAARIFQTPELVNVLRVTGLGLLLVPFSSVPAAILERRLQINRLATIGLFFSLVQGCLVLTLVLCGWGYWALIVGYMIPRVLSAVPGLADIVAAAAPLARRVVKSTRFVRNPLYRIAALLVLLPEYRLCHRGAIDGSRRAGLLFARVHADLLAGGEDRRDVQPGCFPDLLSHERRPRAGPRLVSPPLDSLWVPGDSGTGRPGLVANDAILVALGQKWIPAVLPVQIMSIAGVFMVLGSSIDVLYISRGRPDINFKFTAISVVIYPPLFYLCGRNFGLTGVTLVWAVLYPIMVLLLITATRSITRISVRDVINCQGRIWVSVFCMALVVLATRFICHDIHVVSVRLAISILAGVLGYMAAIRLFAWESVMGNVQLLWRELRSRAVVLDAS